MHGKGADHEQGNDYGGREDERGIDQPGEQAEGGRRRIDWAEREMPVLRSIRERFKKEKMHYAIVIDEYGSTQGIITMDDVLDALIGDASEVEQDEFVIIQRDEWSWLVDGQYSLLEFLKQFDIELPDEVRERYNTVAGMLIYLMGKIPEVGERIALSDYIFEVVDKDGQRIDKILLTYNGKP
jgi:putative hemolysin